MVASNVLKTYLLRGIQSEGWPDRVIAPSPEAYSAQTIVPKEATKADLEKFKADWVAAVKRALKAGVDVSHCLLRGRDIHN